VGGTATTGAKKSFPTEGGKVSPESILNMVWEGGRDKTMESQKTLQGMEIGKEQSREEGREGGFVSGEPGQVTYIKPGERSRKG